YSGRADPVQRPRPAPSARRALQGAGARGAVEAPRAVRKVRRVRASGRWTARPDARAVRAGPWATLRGAKVGRLDAEASGERSDDHCHAVRFDLIISPFE